MLEELQAELMLQEVLDELRRHGIEWTKADRFHVSSHGRTVPYYNVSASTLARNMPKSFVDFAGVNGSHLESPCVYVLDRTRSFILKKHLLDG